MRNLEGNEFHFSTVYSRLRTFGPLNGADGFTSFPHYDTKGMGSLGFKALGSSGP